MKRNNALDIPAAILDAILALDTGKKYLVKFQDRKPAVYYEYIIEELAKDPACEWIMDQETGEIIYFAL